MLSKTALRDGLPYLSPQQDKILACLSRATFCSQMLGRYLEIYRGQNFVRGAFHIHAGDNISTVGLLVIWVFFFFCGFPQRTLFPTNHKLQHCELTMDRQLQAAFNPLNPELNPICYLLALLGAHHFLHVSRIRVKLLTLRQLMSYIYIYGAPILDVSRSHTTTQHSR